jgi:hypothetical protein
MWLICGRGEMRTGFVWRGEGKPGTSKCRCEDDINVDLK